MKALTHTQYGSPDVLRVTDVEKPVPGEGEVLIRIHASSINPADWHYVTGLPYLVRLTSGLRKPKNPIRGLDLAGTVEAVGPAVTRFSVGDSVFGEVGGAYAQFVAVSETRVEPMPSNLTFAQAAAVPVAGLTAIQGLQKHGGLSPDDVNRDPADRKKVLIIGASGGVGHFAVQIAKVWGAEVTGVCSTKNLDLVRSIGADRVIDYTVEDCTAGPDRYDIVFDFAAAHSMASIRRVLADDAVYLPCTDRVGGPALGPIPWTAKRFFRSILPGSNFSVKVFVAAQTTDDMAALTELIESGAVTPILDPTVYDLAKVPDGLRAQEQGHARGKKSVEIS